MSTSAAQKLARQRYKEKSIELVAFEVKKGMSKEYSAAAAKLGLGKMEMIRRSIAEFIANHAGEDFSKQLPPMSNQPQQKISELDKQLLNLPTESKKHLLKFLESLKQQDNSKGGGNDD